MFFKKIGQIVDALSSLPKLKELYLDEISGHDRDIFRQNLPNLKKLNGKILQTHNITFNYGQKIQTYVEGFNQQEKEFMSNPLTMFFNCINNLFQEKEKNYDIRNNISADLKHKLKDMAQELSSRETIETLEAYDQKTEAEINWFILQQLSVFLQKYGDDRISSILQSITITNKNIMD